MEITETEDRIDCFSSKVETKEPSTSENEENVDWILVKKLAKLTNRAIRESEESQSLSPEMLNAIREKILAHLWK